MYTAAPGTWCFMLAISMTGWLEMLGTSLLCAGCDSRAHQTEVVGA